MAYCTNCGQMIAETARFCPNCGTARAASVLPVTAVNNRTHSDYNVMLVSLGRCSTAIACDLIEEICGYDEVDARLMVAAIPVVVADNLTERQAAILAEAFSEYGMDVSVYDSHGYRVVQSDIGSVFDNSGNILSAAAAVLNLIGAGNRLARARIRRYDLPFGRPTLHRCAYIAPRPAPRRAMPRPAPRPAPAPRPVAPHPMHPHTGPRPAPSPNQSHGMNDRRGPGGPVLGGPLGPKRGPGGHR